MEIFRIDENLYQSSAIETINDTRILRKEGIKIVIDLEGNLDPRRLGDFLRLYIFWPILDEGLPNLKLLNDITDLGRDLKKNYRILTHCTNGINRASLINGLILYKEKGLKGKALVNYIRDKRPGALANQNFVNYLLWLD